MELLAEVGFKPIGNNGERKKFGLYKCPICNTAFECIISNVIRGNTTKCHSCAKEMLAQHLMHRAGANFAVKCSIIHNDKYDYSKVQYKGKYVPVEIICPIHGSFWQKPREHRNGSGCQSCAVSGFDKNKAAILYYVKVEHAGISLYKIGVTNATVEERFKGSDMAKITIIKTWDFAVGADALSKEQEIIKQYKEFKYVGAPVLNAGNTELFIKNILNIEETL